MSTGYFSLQVHWLLFCLLFLGSLSGCNHVVQDDVQPSVVPQSSYTLNSPETVEESLSQWWQVFNDPLLDKYIAKALANNFTLKEGFARLKQARYFQNQEDAHLYPLLDGRMRAESEWKTENDRKDTNKVK